MIDILGGSFIHTCGGGMANLSRSQSLISILSIFHHYSCRSSFCHAGIIPWQSLAILARGESEHLVSLQSGGYKMGHPAIPRAQNLAKQPISVQDDDVA
jgi:hypothetical protein